EVRADCGRGLTRSGDLHWGLGGGEVEGSGADEVFRGVPAREQERDRGPPVLLLAALLEAPAIRGHQGPRRGDQLAASLVDAGAPLAGLRAAGEGQGPGSVLGSAAHRHRLSDTLCASPAGRAGPLRRAGAAAVRELDGPAGEPRAEVHAGAGPLAR